MIQQQSINFSITKEFRPILDEFIRLCEADDEYRALINARFEIDKRISQNKRTASMIRFGLSLARKELIKRGVEKKNEISQNRNS